MLKKFINKRQGNGGIRFCYLPPLLLKTIQSLSNAFLLYGFTLDLKGIYIKPINIRSKKRQRSQKNHFLFHDANIVVAV